MGETNILLEKAMAFAVRIVKLSRHLTEKKKERILSAQILRNGTGIGANATEAVYGVSKADFIAKMQIALKEAAETEYWLRLLELSGYITARESESLRTDCLAIKRILVATLNTAKKNKE